MKAKTVVACGDKHLPYEQGSIARQILNIIEAEKPFYVVQMGDLYDFFHTSRYPKSMLSFEPEKEIAQGRRAAEAFWSAVQKASPRSKCFQIKGNHDDRPYKRLLERAPELEPFFGPTLRSLFEFNGVETIHSSREELELDTTQGKVLFHHGHRGRLGDHLIYNQQSTVNGHSHTGGVFFKAYRDGVRFELNCGYSGDPDVGPLQYGEQARKYWTHGVGIIDELGPRFVPLAADRKRRAA